MALTVAAGLGAVAAWAQPAAIGGATSAVELGRPLDFQALLRVQAGEVLEARCVQAEVAIGDRRLPPGAVRLDLEPAGDGAARVRVRTTLVVDEPTVSLQLHAGCDNRVSRLFVLMADPAGLAPAPPLFPAAQASGLVPAAAPAAAAVPARGTVPAAPPRSTATAPRSLPPAVTSPAVRPTQARAATPSAQPRLRLDPADSAEVPGLVAEEVLDQALQAVALATSATRAAQAQAQAQALRIAELERSVGGLQARAVAAEAGQQAALARAERAEQRSRWFMPLLVGAGVLALLAAWLAWQMQQQRRIRQAAWQRARTDDAATEGGEARPSRQPTVPVPLSGREATMPGRLGARGAAVSAWPAASVSALDTLPPQDVNTAPGALPVAPSAMTSGPGVRPVAGAGRAPGLAAGLPSAPASGAVADAASRAMQRTDVLPYGAGAAVSAPRDVSIEELIDLEQQAEFFIVLGQDESAIDLLVEHLRSTGGGSPLPYLKLLEIYRRRGDREAYERTRTRFNHRFNAYAPSWEADPLQGRTLEDYPDVMPRLQQVWSRPLDAMAELEALLFRKSRGELFDLPAYREVLFLYSLARDLLDREAADTGSVDLLLPLSAAGDPGVPEDSRWASADSDFGDDASRPTAPVDLDLTLPDTPRSSIFDPLVPGRPRG